MPFSGQNNQDIVHVQCLLQKRKISNSQNKNKIISNLPIKLLLLLLLLFFYKS